MARNKNSNARGGFFNCSDCGKKTRHTGEQSLNSDLCVACWDLAGLENEHQDGYHADEPHADCPDCAEAIKAAAEAKPAKKTRKPAAKKVKVGSPEHVEQTERVAKAPKVRRVKAKKSTDPRAEAITDEWKNGATLAQLVTKHNLKRSALRRMITLTVGGKAEFQKLRKIGAGGTRQRAARQEKQGRAGGPRGEDHFNVMLEDANVPVITSAKKSDGWSYTRIRDVSIHTAPDGTSYVEARPNEKCDLIYHFSESHRSAGLPDVRLRKFEDSSKGRRIKKAVAKDEAIAAATKQRKARKPRKARA